MTSAPVFKRRAEEPELSEKDKERKENKSVKRQRLASENSSDEKPYSITKRERKDSSTTFCSHCKIYGHSQETCNCQREQSPHHKQQKRQQQRGQLHGKSRRFPKQPPIKRSPERPPRSTVKMTNRCYDTFEQEELSDETLQAAADLFSSNYGVWGEKATEMVGSWAEKGDSIVNIFDSKG